MGRAFLVLGGLGIVGGAVLIAVGAVFEMDDPSGPFPGIMVIMFGIPIMVAGALCLAAGIGLLQRKRWGRTLALVMLWVILVFGTVSMIGNLAAGEIGITFVSLIVALFGFRFLNHLRNDAVKAYFSPKAPPPVA
ncbi:MAG: hypothetical protein Q7T26_00275 [Dehalococcoidia bacterium]|nr:hypothetical protein [Dehalococcoidia bacterium]